MPGRRVATFHCSFSPRSLRAVCRPSLIWVRGRARSFGAARRSSHLGASQLRELDFKSGISLDGTRPANLHSPLSYGAMLAWSRNWIALCPHCLRNRSRRYRIAPRGSAASEHNHIRRRIGADIPSARSCDRNRPPSLSRSMSERPPVLSSQPRSSLARCTMMSRLFHR